MDIHSNLNAFYACLSNLRKPRSQSWRFPQRVIEHSGLLKQFPEIDLNKQKVRIFGKIAKLDAKVEENCRVEIYRPITVDPTTVERRDLKENWSV